MEAIRKEAARLDPTRRTAVLAAVDELVAAIGTRDGEAGMMAVRRIQTLSPEVGTAVLDYLVDEGLSRMAEGSGEQ